MLIVAAGLMRSGSTWQFNAIKTILHHAGIDDCVGCLAQDATWRASSNSIVKIHAWTSELAEQADFIFTSHRDVRDACASLVRFHPNRNPPACEKILKEFGNYRRWAEIADYDMKYEDMVQNPGDCVQSIINVMGLSGIDVVKVVAEVNAIKPPERVPGRREDPETLLWSKHITNGVPGTFRETLTAAEIDQIENKLGWWLVEMGYMKGTVQG